MGFSAETLHAYIIIFVCYKQIILIVRRIIIFFNYIGTSRDAEILIFQWAGFEPSDFTVLGIVLKLISTGPQAPVRTIIIA